MTPIRKILADLEAIAQGGVIALLLAIAFYFLAATLAGCCAPIEEQGAPFCWLTGETTNTPRLRCRPSLAECTEDAITYGGGPWACEGHGAEL
jgi:hypothetical protein